MTAEKASLTLRDSGRVRSWRVNDLTPDIFASLLTWRKNIWNVVASAKRSYKQEANRIKSSAQERERDARGRRTPYATMPNNAVLGASNE